MGTPDMSSTWNSNTLIEHLNATHFPRIPSRIEVRLKLCFLERSMQLPPPIPKKSRKDQPYPNSALVSCSSASRHEQPPPTDCIQQLPTSLGKDERAPLLSGVCSLTLSK
ncbi:hypothetical protein KIL84_023366 [Mauremys mutica]|uniref:Uncharacterized protein n=1 Tax=Mauremys mutica TaxID=74926 RepID=A0A9D4ALW8_9SAUR|nr:hypothetical protein KIL84_023366 [Mauremys mutica]